MPRRSHSSDAIRVSKGDLLSASVPSKSNTISFFIRVFRFPARSPHLVAEMYTRREPQATELHRPFGRHKWLRRVPPAQRPRHIPARAAHPLRQRQKAIVRGRATTRNIHTERVCCGAAPPPPVAPLGPPDPRENQYS